MKQPNNTPTPAPAPVHPRVEKAYELADWMATHARWRKEHDTRMLELSDDLIGNIYGR
jgi:hypothetical protein